MRKPRPKSSKGLKSLGATLAQASDSPAPGFSSFRKATVAGSSRRARVGEKTFEPVVRTTVTKARASAESQLVKHEREIGRLIARVKHLEAQITKYSAPVIASKETTERAGTLAGELDAAVAARDLPAFRGVIGVTQEESAKLFDCSLRAIQNYETGKQDVPARCVRTMREITHILSAVESIYGAEGAVKWLRSPVPAMDDRTPLRIIEDGGVARLMLLVNEAALGEFN
jgi:hypothetical protein